jgi:hypothetical protein
MATTDEEIIERFRYKEPSDTVIVDAHDLVREEFKELALKMNDILPEGREKALVLTRIEEAMHWANSSIALNQSVLRS